LDVLDIVLFIWNYSLVFRLSTNSALGAGKSFLSSTLVSHLSEISSQNRGSARSLVGFFYIQEDDTELRSLNTVLKTVAYQFQAMNPVYAKYLIQPCSNPQKTVNAIETWKNLFLEFFCAPKTQYGDNTAFIVLDGVDEAPRKEREMLFKLLKELEDSSKTNSPPRIRVMIIGRPGKYSSAALVYYYR
jgi:hypothetical protein